MSSKNWVVTINNYTDDDVACFKRDSSLFVYWAYAFEIGESGTPHIQGFICMCRRVGLRVVKKMFPRGHIERMNGNINQNEKYCSKQGELVSFGEAPLNCGDKEKKRWVEIKDAMKRGALEELPEDVFVRYYKTAKLIAKDYMRKPVMLDDVCGTWIYGEPGSGKSYAVVSQHPERYIKPINKWWDGYQSEEVVHLDELEPTHSSWIASYLKKWADRYPFDAEIKGGAMQIRPRRIIVTSNYKIDDMGFDGITTVAIKRRFIEIKKEIDQNIIL